MLKLCLSVKSLKEIKQFLNIVGGYEETAIPCPNYHDQTYHLEKELVLSDWELVSFFSPDFTLCPRCTSLSLL